MHGTSKMMNLASAMAQAGLRCLSGASPQLAPADGRAAAVAAAAAAASEQPFTGHPATAGVSKQVQGQQSALAGRPASCGPQASRWGRFSSAPACALLHTEQVQQTRQQRVES